MASPWASSNDIHGFQCLDRRHLPFLASRKDSKWLSSSTTAKSSSHSSSSGSMPSSTSSTSSGPSTSSSNASSRCSSDKLSMSNFASSGGRGIAGKYASICILSPSVNSGVPKNKIHPLDAFHRFPRIANGCYRETSWGNFFRDQTSTLCELHKSSGWIGLLFDALLHPCCGFL